MTGKPPATRPRWRRNVTSGVLALVLLASLLGLGRLGRLMISKATRTLASSPPRSALIVFDDAGDEGYVGAMHAVLLENLLGHFDIRVERQPVSTYKTGDTDHAAVVFYMGSVPGTVDLHPFGSRERAAYKSFLVDVATTDRTVVWIGSNLAALQESMGRPAFRDRFGFSFQRNDDGYNRVRYKGVELDKGVVRHQPGARTEGCRPDGDGRSNCADSVGVVSVEDPDRVFVAAHALSVSAGREAPYVTRGRNLWYVADVPFSYASEGDRYLAFADLLHDMLRIDHQEDRRALVRIEDVSAKNDLRVLSAAADVLQRHQAPFGVAAIPYYRNPAQDPPEGPVAQGLAGTAVGQALTGWVRDRGAFIVQHGTTHQWDDGPNPDDGVSGTDFEFYRVTRQADGVLRFVGPLPQDSPDWARDRLQRGRTELRRAGLPPSVWEAPHYLASTANYRVARELYRAQWGRVAYFGWSRFGTQVTTQFFPYVVRDSYGQVVVPENLGNVTTSAPVITPQDLVRRAAKQLVVRDGVASFFFHPYLDAALLDATLTGIERLGYRFVRPCLVIGSC